MTASFIALQHENGNWWNGSIKPAREHILTPTEKECEAKWIRNDAAGVGMGYLLGTLNGAQDAKLWRVREKECPI